jgi:hypothetical protein
MNLPGEASQVKINANTRPWKRSQSARIGAFLASVCLVGPVGAATRPFPGKQWRRLSGGVLSRVHDTRPEKSTWRQHLSYSALSTTYALGPAHIKVIEPGGRINTDGKTIARMVGDYFRDQNSGSPLGAHWLRTAPGNRYAIEMGPEGVIATARLNARLPAAKDPVGPEPFHSFKAFGQGGRELHAFEYQPNETVKISFARKKAIDSYRARHREANIFHRSEKLIVRPDGSQRLTILFDPKALSNHLPLE